MERDRAESRSWQRLVDYFATIFLLCRIFWRRFGLLSKFFDLLVSFLTGHVWLPRNILLHTPLLYSFPLLINDTSLLVSSGTNSLNYSIQLEFLPPRLHRRLPLHSECHLSSKTYPLTPDLHWHQYQPALVTWFKQPLQVNDFITLIMLPFIPLARVIFNK